MMDEYFRLGLELLGVMTGMGLAIQAGGATVAWGSQVWGWQRRASFLDKFGRQMLGLSMVGFLGAVFCALAGLGLGHVRYGLQIQSAAVAGLPWLAVSWPLAGLGLGLVFSLLAAKTWKPLKRRKAMQALVLLPAWLSLWAGLYTGLNIYSQGFLHMFSPIQAPGLEAVWQVQLSPAWVLLAGQALVVGLGGAGAAGMAYLLARRNIEDFGRDYYRFALPHAAKWAAVLLGQALFLAWVVDRQALAVWLLPCREMIALGAALGGFVVYGVLLIVFLRSDNPLRAKASALGASGVGIAAAAAAALSQLWLWS